MMTMVTTQRKAPVWTLLPATLDLAPQLIVRPKLQHRARVDVARQFNLGGIHDQRTPSSS